MLKLVFVEISLVEISLVIQNATNCNGMINCQFDLILIFYWWLTVSKTNWLSVGWSLLNLQQLNLIIVIDEVRQMDINVAQKQLIKMPIKLRSNASILKS